MLPYKDSDNLYMEYEGPFTIEIISTLAKSIQHNIVTTELVRKKLYRVFIELTQNVSLYSFNRVLMAKGTSIGKGKVFIHYTNDGFICTTINKILKDHSSILVNNCININSSTIDQLRLMKKKLREMSTFQDTGAHIGLIMISIYSGNPIVYEIINDKNTGDTYFSISATIFRKTNS